MIGKLYRFLKYYFVRLRYVFNPSVLLGKQTSISSSAKLNTSMGGKINIGAKTEILGGVIVSTYGGNISIGNHCSINPYTIIYGHGNTVIGNNVLIGGHTMIIPNNHNFSDVSRPINSQGGTAKGIVIEDDVWISHACSILDDVTIGKGSVIGAGSVVNKNIPPYSIAVGVPAKVISSRLSK
jgi:acetyltransferase-like isoleucine patch superfamily enzyme